MSHKNPVVKTSQWTSLEACKKSANELFDLLGDKAIICLDGPMGVGKTQFTRFLMLNLGFEDVASPTFSLQNIYETPGKLVYHFDLHRIESDEELDTTGLWDSFQEPAWVIIEWSEKLNRSQLPKSWPLYVISISENREVQFSTYAAD